MFHRYLFSKITTVAYNEIIKYIPITIDKESIPENMSLLGCKSRGSDWMTFINMEIIRPSLSVLIQFLATEFWSHLLEKPVADVFR